jgi:hypothetical protein
MLRATGAEAVSILVLRNIPDIPGTDWDLWATQAAFVVMGFCALVLLYAMLNGK